ncbi:MAG: DUF5640 domain-containing protein [Oscillospiraceae bacterium]|nr:DUF5640 domain-containing protein [Oscillospiraceae bacterium]
MAKRILALTLALTMILGLAVTFAGCSNADVSDHALVGTWAWADDADYIYSFNTDGTGTRGGAGMAQQNFAWTIPGGGRVYMFIDRVDVLPGNLRLEQWDYHIAGNMLTLTSRQVANTSRRYFRLGNG